VYFIFAISSLPPYHSVTPHVAVSPFRGGVGTLRHGLHNSPNTKKFFGKILERTDNVILGAENFGGNFVDLTDPLGVTLNPPNGIKKMLS